MKTVYETGKTWDEIKRLPKVYEGPVFSIRCDGDNHYTHGKTLSTQKEFIAWRGPCDCN